MGIPRLPFLVFICYSSKKYLASLDEKKHLFRAASHICPQEFTEDTRPREERKTISSFLIVRRISFSFHFVSNILNEFVL